MGDSERIRQILQSGDLHATAELLPLVYDELRKLAARKLAREPSGQTLQATALVHEAYLRIAGSGGERQPAWHSHAQFFAAAAEAMRRILIDRARAKRARKRGGDRRRVRLESVELTLDPPEGLLDLDDALSKLAARDRRKADLVTLRYFAGLSVAEAADVLGIAKRTAEEDWTYSRAWLFHELTRGWPTGDP